MPGNCRWHQSCPSGNEMNLPQADGRGISIRRLNANLLLFFFWNWPHYYPIGGNRHVWVGLIFCICCSTLQPMMFMWTCRQWHVVPFHDAAAQNIDSSCKQLFRGLWKLTTTTRENFFSLAAAVWQEAVHLYDMAGAGTQWTISAN